MKRRALLLLAIGALVAPAAARADDALRVFVIRHANAWKNVAPSQRPAGMSDDELDALTPAGLARAEQVGAQLAGQGIVAVYCSPARRAQQTAAAIAKRIGLADPPIVDDAFRTLDSGTDKDASSGMVRMKSWKAGKDPRPPAGESLADGFARATARLEQLRAKYPGRAIAVVTHGEIAASLLSKAAGRDIVGGYFDHFPDEGSVHEIRLGH